ncbi:hypothetical protein [Candidatus Mycoplasma haematominutum]|uniref:Uncharacterized protein n=1 Tax=Candidatus Mycoplasma haematominutum 'Birmingham 1' TaxID=1116213 RepID=G8C3P1_9MOLU|nr:hypothetical protein [Candidatus Mycoplasma haematominutum]CCE66939.1 hypothetical protein MHM_04210 [Candidatus Mycoplasma haematominutum 'Birmingham 1']
MFLSPKLLLALVTAVIFGSAVGLPMSFSAQKGLGKPGTAQTGGAELTLDLNYRSVRLVTIPTLLL